MKKILFLLIVLFSISIFASLTVIPDATVVEVGSSLGIKVISDKTVFVEFSLGGFEPADVVFDGIVGDSYVYYIAPLIEASDTLTFKTSDESTSITIYFVKSSKEVKNKSFAKVKSFSGHVAIKKGDLWNPITSETVIEEGNEILTMENSFVEVEFEDGSVSKILENSQVLFERIRYDKGVVDIVMDLKKGKSYNIVQKLLNKFSKFRIKTKSVTAGVRGTRFAVFENGKILTYEGRVFAYFSDGKVLPITEGYALESFEKPKKVDIPEEEFVKVTPEKPTTKKEEVKEKEKTTSIQPSVPPVSVGPVKKGNNYYMVYSIAPEFDFGLVRVGLGFTAYSTDVSGNLYYGLPSDNPSTNIINGLTLNSLAFKIFNVDFRYGNMLPKSLGLGFTTRNYYNPFSKSFDVEYDSGKLALYARLPYELLKIYPIEFLTSDSIFLAEASVKFDLPFIGESSIGLGITIDTQASSAFLEDTSATPIESAYSLFLKKEIFKNFDFGIELSVENGLNDYSLGSFAGFYGNFSLVNLTAGIYYYLDGFVPFYFNNNYSYLKSTSKLPAMDSEGSSGYLSGFDFDTSFAKGKLYLYGTLTNFSSPTLEGQIEISIPQIGTFSGLSIAGYYFDKTPFEGSLFSLDTTSYLKIIYPLAGESFSAGVIFIWDGEKWSENVIIGVDLWR